MVIALAGHLMAGGAVPGMASVLALAWIGGCCVLLADRQRSFGSILAACSVAQVAFHLMFAVSGAPHAAHSAAATSTSVFADLSMIAGHALAAILTAALLAYGDTVLWSLFHAVRLVQVPPVVPPQPTVRLAVIRAADHVSRWYDFLAQGQPRRGPPAAVAA